MIYNSITSSAHVTTSNTANPPASITIIGCNCDSVLVGAISVLNIVLVTVPTCIITKIKTFIMISM